MRQVNINYIDIEQYEYVNAKPIYKDGALLLSEGIKLNEVYFELLKKKGIRYIYINDELSQGIEIDENLSQEKFDEMKGKLKDQFRYVGQEKSIGLNLTLVNNTVKDLIEIMLDKKDIANSINAVQDDEDFFYDHSLNTAMSCIYMGVVLGWDMGKLFHLGMGALLHDIGKLFIPKELLNKKELTKSELELYKKHPELGYRHIKDTYKDEFSSQTRQVILQHHERIDGSGYPNQLSGDSVFQMAQICAIADIYDNLVNKEKLPLYLASEYLYTQGGLDMGLVKIFLSRLVKYKEGTLVKLSDGSRGIVYKLDKSHLDRPIIKILVDKNKKSIWGAPEYIDLKKDLTLFIEGNIDFI